MDDWKPNKTLTYRFQSEYAEIVFNVPGMAEWSEEEWDSAADSDLKSYVTSPEDYWLDDTWEIEMEGLSNG